MSRRKFTFWFFTTLLLIVLVAGLIISPLGTPVIRYIANKAVDGLHIENINGTVLSDFSVEGVSWQNEQWSVNVKRAEINVVLGCLITSKVCIDYLNVDGTRVEQLSEAPAEDEPEPESTEPVEIPVPVKINTLGITDVSVKLLAGHITLQSLSLEGQVFKEVTLSPVNIEGLIVALPESTEKAADNAGDDKPVSYALSYKAPELPEIVIPIPVTVENFTLRNTKLKQGDVVTQEMALLSFSTLTLESSDIALDKLHVEHTLAKLDADAKVTLSGDYALSLAASADVNAAGVEEQVNVSADGSLKALALDVDASGTYSASVAGNASILDDTLPLELSVSWPEQPVPDVKDTRLWEGALDLTGTMGNYHFTAKTGATLPDIGDIPVDADVVLNSNNITVNALTVDILEGKITNTGTLFLNESVSWSGKTRLNGISARSLSPYAPSQIEGGLTSLMQLTDKGVEVSVTDLAVDGIRDGSELNVTGSLVYSQASDLIVTNLGVVQEKNRVHVAAQVFNQRYINADIDLDVDATEQLYPDVSGQIKGRIKAKGEWSDPVAEGDITLTGVKVSPVLSALAAEQGEMNGNLGISGSLSAHNFNVDLTLPDHHLKLEMDGAWKDERYTADITNSQLGLLTTRWQLNQPFRVAVRPEPFSMKISENCWESRENGELCIEDVLFKDERTKWIVKANGLPLGLWAHELLPDTFTASSDAKLSVNTTGEFGKNAPMTANFDLAVTPSVWTMGPEQQLKLNLDEVSAKGRYEDDLLTSTLNILSEQLGAVNADMKVRPVEENIPLEGTVNIDNIRIAPFKPMSKAIRELEGSLNGQLAIKGTASSPSLTGSVKLTNGNVDIEDMPVKIGDWEQTIEFVNRSATFNGAFLLGEGKGTLSGDVNWEDELTANVNLKGKRFQINQRDIRMQVSPDITASIKPGNVKVTGNVNLPWARVKIEELPASAVSPSKDVHLRGEPPVEDPLDIIDATVMVNIDKDKTGEVKLDAFGLTANLYGGIEVRTHPALVGYGDLQILDGRYQAYGQDLIIQTGEVQFNGPLDQPMLLVEAIRDPDKTEDGVVAGIRIDGAADSPNINLFSEPAMNQSNSLSYLLTGSGPGSSSSSSPDYNALLLGFGLSNTEKLQGKVGSALGIEDFSVGTTSSAGGGATKLSLNGRINDRLTVQYNVDVGLSGDNSSTQTLRRRQEPPDLALRYRLLPKLFVEGVQTTIEEQTEFAIDFYYEFFLGGPQEAEKKADDEADEE